MEKLLAAKNPVVLCSFGKESLVLLKMVMEIMPDITILSFFNHLNPFAEKIIREWDLTVASYAPAVRYQVEDTVVSEYAIGDARLPLLQDISEHGEPIGMVTTPQFEYNFDLTLFGYRKADHHPLVGRTLEKEFQLGPTTMYAPLYDWSETEVFAALEGVPYEPFCDDVLKPNLPVVAKEDFQARFNLGGKYGEQQK